MTMDQIIEIIGDTSEEARVWVMTSLDEDEDCFDGMTAEQIRREWRRYREEVYGH